MVYSQIVSWYHNSSEWLDLRDASSWGRNPTDFTSVEYLTSELSLFSARAKVFFTYIFLHIHNSTDSFDFFSPSVPISHCTWEVL